MLLCTLLSLMTWSFKADYVIEAAVRYNFGPARRSSNQDLPMFFYRTHFLCWCILEDFVGSPSAPLGYNLEVSWPRAPGLCTDSVQAPHSWMSRVRPILTRAAAQPSPSFSKAPTGSCFRAVPFVRELMSLTGAHRVVVWLGQYGARSPRPQVSLIVNARRDHVPLHFSRNRMFSEHGV
jgi:hypothetical protein